MFPDVPVAAFFDTVDLRLVVCHLGSEESLAVVAGGRSVDTTMGFTPLDGLVAATRACCLDPASPLWLLAHGVSAAELQDALEHRSGPHALPGTADMRRLRARAAAGDEVAVWALRVYHPQAAGLRGRDGRRAGRPRRVGVHRRGC
jgi:acetate kinase